MMAFAFAATAAVRAHAGRIDEAKHDLRRAKDLLAFLGDFVPWYGAETSVLLARRHCGSPTSALRAHCSPRLRASLARFPTLSSSTGGSATRGDLMDGLAESSLASTSTLTIAELRVLRFLPSHRSFREIADQLGVSANTVKSQAHAGYPQARRRVAVGGGRAGGRGRVARSVTRSATGQRPSKERLACS